MVSGLTEIEAVGAGAGGGGGGGGGAVFLWQAPSIMTVHNAITVASVLKVNRRLYTLRCCVWILFTLILPANSKRIPSSDEVFIYFQLQFGCELRPVKVS